MRRRLSRVLGSAVLARIALGLQDCLYLGNLDARRDWGHAKDYVRAMWLMLQQPAPEDYVIATGEQHSVRDFVYAAAAELGMRLFWEGTGADEEGRVHAVDAEGAATIAPGQTIVRVDKRYFRPAEVDLLLGDASKVRNKLGWEPKVTFNDLVKLMTDHDLKLARQEAQARELKHSSATNKARWGSL